MDDSDDEAAASYFLPGGIADDGPPRASFSTFGGIRSKPPSNSLLSGLGGEPMPVQNRQRFGGFGFAGNGSIGVIGSTASPFARPSYMNHAPSKIASSSTTTPLRAPPGLGSPAQESPRVMLERQTQQFGGFMSHLQSPNNLSSPMLSTPPVALYHSDSNTSNTELAELNTTSVVVSHTIENIDPTPKRTSQLFGRTRSRAAMSKASQAREQENTMERYHHALAKEAPCTPSTNVDSPSSASSSSLSSKESMSPVAKNVNIHVESPVAPGRVRIKQRSPQQKPHVHSRAVPVAAHKPSQPVQEPSKGSSPIKPILATSKAPEAAKKAAEDVATHEPKHHEEESKPSHVQPSLESPRSSAIDTTSPALSPKNVPKAVIEEDSSLLQSSEAEDNVDDAEQVDSDQLNSVESLIHTTDDVEQVESNLSEDVVPRSLDESNEESCEDDIVAPRTPVKNVMNKEITKLESEEEARPKLRKEKRSERLRKESSRKERKQLAKRRELEVEYEATASSHEDDLALDSDFHHGFSLKSLAHKLFVVYIRWLSILAFKFQSLASAALNFLFTIGLQAASYALSFHRHALRGLLVNRNIGSCFAFLYLFPFLVQYVIPWAPPWAPVCLWYAFLVQLFCTQGSTAMVATFRILLPLVFLVEGVSHHSFLLDLNGAELLLISFILSALKTGNMCSPVFFLSLSIQCVSAVFLGSELLVQWAQLAIALYSLNAMSSLQHDWSLLEGGEENGHRHFIGDYHQPVTGPSGASIQKTKRLDRRSLASVVKGRNKARGNSNL